MITIGKKIYSILVNNTAVAALVSTKIYPLIIPENTTLPCVVYERSFDNEYVKDGLAGSRSTINITVISDNYDKTIAIAAAIHTALDQYHGDGIRMITLESGSEVYAEGAFLQNLTFSVKE